MPLHRALIACLLLFTTAAGADTPRLAIIIDDIGYRHIDGRRAVNLPGAIACAFLPHAPHTRELALAAHARNKEILLHVPMQALASDKKLGPGSLTLDMDQHQFVRTLQQALKSVPHVSGVNNHMGSLLTSEHDHMVWLMRELQHRGDLFFVDSRTTAASVAHQVALENGVPSMQRDVFLDAERDPAFIARQFARAIHLAKLRGGALIIAHPYEETLDYLVWRLPDLEAEGVRLVSLQELMLFKHKQVTAWHVSSSLSPKAAKNSKQSR